MEGLGGGGPAQCAVGPVVVVETAELLEQFVELLTGGRGVAGN